MKEYFIFPNQGKRLRISDYVGGQIKLDMIDVIGCATPVAFFEQEKLIKDLRDMANYVEKYGKHNKT